MTSGEFSRETPAKKGASTEKKKGTKKEQNRY
jgi:hypothetical protein